MKKILYIGLPVIFLIAAYFLFFHSSAASGKNKYVLAEITRGDLENVVSSTGTIEAVGTVEVGTQVSGTIAKVFVDFNDQVRKRQILAILDTIPLRTQVMDAEARLEEARAQLELAQYDYQQNLELYKKKLISEAQFLQSKVKLKTQQAAVKSAKASLARATRNLHYAYIQSPIDGTVIQRNVETGQTVAASFNTPTLFIIAEDLSKMEIHALVDESDIGQIKEGQHARFTVEAYPDKVFEGTVRQIRLQPQTIQNVVNYTVVVDAQNREHLLLPGMTATIDFVVEQRSDVLLIPNAALQFKPPPGMIEKLRAEREKRYSQMPDSLKQKMRSHFAGGANAGFPDRQTGGDSGRNFVRIWFIDRQGNPSTSVLKPGATDGKMTEIVRGRRIREGMKVITGIWRQQKDETRSRRPSSTFRRRRPF